MSEWKTRALGEVLSISHGYAFPGDGFSDDPEYPTLVTPRNFKVGGGFKPAKPKTYHGEYPPEYRLMPGDVIVTMTDLSKNTDTLGYSAVIPDDGVTYLHNQRIGKVRVKDHGGADLSFMSYFLRQRDYRSFVVGSASGSTVKHTSPNRIESYAARLPPLDEQRRIASVLGAFDELIEMNRRMATALDETARVAWRGHVAEIDPPFTPLSGMANVVLGGTPKRSNPEFWEGHIPWLNSGKANEFRVMEGAEGITQAGCDKSSTKLLPRGATLVAITGATMGKVTRTEIEACGNQSLVGVYVDDDCPLSDHIYLSVSDEIEQVTRHATGGAQQHVNKGNVEQMLVPSPTPDLLAVIRTDVTPLLASIEPLLTEADELARTRDELLPLLMSGKVRVEDVEIPKGAA